MVSWNGQNINFLVGTNGAPNITGQSTLALDAAVKGKLRKGIAHDITMKHVADLMEHIPGEETQDESVSEAQHNAMEAAAHGRSKIGIPKKVAQDFVAADKAKTAHKKRR